jgi:hypothetical protein
MSKARDLINAHLYPALATFAVIYGAIQIAPIANQARHYNNCVEGLIASFEKKRETSIPTNSWVRTFLTGSDLRRPLKYI